MSVSKPFLVASILVFITAGWLLLTGSATFHDYVDDRDITITTSYNETTNETFVYGISFNSMRLLSLSAIISGCICVGAGINILQRKNISLVLPSMVLACIIAALLGHYNDYYAEVEPPTGFLQFTPLFSGVAIWLPTILLSGIAFAIVIWKYREFE